MGKQQYQASLCFLIGLPGSGKSTVARKWSLHDNDLVILSSDTLRENLLGDVNNQDNNSYIFDYMNKEAVRVLNLGGSVVLDATNIKKKNRMNTIRVIKSQLKENINLKITYYIMATPFEKCLELNNKRERIVSERVLYRMLSQFEFPDYEEQQLVEIILNNDLIDDNYPRIMFDKIKYGNTPHDNPHHTFTIEEHMRQAATIARDYNNNLGFIPITISTTAYYHDIGKLYTKQFKNDIAHYLGHDNAGAYIVMTIFAKNLILEDFIKIIMLIQYHMQIYNVKTEKSVEKLKQHVGPHYESLKILHQIDKEAH